MKLAFFLTVYVNGSRNKQLICKDILKKMKRLSLK